MELGMVRERTLSHEKYAKQHTKNALFYCRKPNAEHVARDCLLKKKRARNGMSC